MHECGAKLVPNAKIEKKKCINVPQLREYLEILLEYYLPLSIIFA